MEVIEDASGEFEKQIADIKADIRLEFLAMSKSNRKGFFISLEKAYYWLHIKYNNTAEFRSNFKKRILNDENNYFIEAKHEGDYAAHYIYRINPDSGNTRIKYPWFSDEGFKLLCMISRAPKATLIRQYYLELEKEYIASLEMERDEFDIIRKRDIAAIADLHKKLESINITLHTHKKNLDIKERQLADYVKQNQYLSYRVFQLRDIETLLNTNYDIDPYDPISTARLSLYEKKYGKPAYVYLVSDKWINKKINKELTSMRRQITYTQEQIDDINTHLLNYNLNVNIEFEDITETWMREVLICDSSYTNIGTDSPLYIYISKPRKFEAEYVKLMDIIYFYDEYHYSKFIEILNGTELYEQLPMHPQFKNKILAGLRILPFSDISASHRDAAANLEFNNQRNQLINISYL